VVHLYKTWLSGISTMGRVIVQSRGKVNSEAKTVDIFADFIVSGLAIAPVWIL